MGPSGNSSGRPLFFLSCLELIEDIPYQLTTVRVANITIQDINVPNFMDFNLNGCMNRQALLTNSNRANRDVESLQKKMDILHNEAVEILNEVKSLPVIYKSALYSANEKIERGINLNETIKDLEVRLIKRALELSGGRQNRAAKLLNIKHTTLHEKIRRYRLNHNETFPTDT